MAKIYFRYGVMNSSKTANALMVAYNYAERNQKALLVKPPADDREGREPRISSRIGLSMPAVFAGDFALMTDEELAEYDCVILVEAQFFGVEVIERLVHIADDLNLPCICYGLRTDFRGVLFPASLRLMELADTIEEVKTVCWCGKKALYNARLDEAGQMVVEGPQIYIGGNESYTTLCRKHYNLRQPFPPEKEGTGKARE